MVYPNRDNRKRELIAKLHGEGMRIADIARLLGVSRQRIHALLNEDPETGRRYRADEHNEYQRKARAAR